MKVAIVGPGIMPIPPTGWGAVEILIWDQKIALENLGHTVEIINTKNPAEIIQQVNACRPDFVHIQYDDFVGLVPYIQYPCAITTTLDTWSNPIVGTTMVIVLPNLLHRFVLTSSVCLLESKRPMRTL